MNTKLYMDTPFVERGRDTDGVDCWGLVRLVLAREFGVDVPSYADGYERTGEREKISGLVEQERGDWFSVAPCDVRPGDVVLLAITGYPCHVGIVIGGGLMLNARSGVGVAVEEYMRPYWRRRLRGFYRHRALMDWVTTEVPQFEFTGYQPDYC